MEHQIWNHPIESTYKRFFRFRDDIMLYDILSYATNCNKILYIYISYICFSGDNVDGRNSAPLKLGNYFLLGLWFLPSTIIFGYFQVGTCNTAWSICLVCILVALLPASAWFWSPFVLRQWAQWQKLYALLRVDGWGCVLSRLLLLLLLLLSYSYSYYSYHYHYHCHHHYDCDYSYDYDYDYDYDHHEKKKERQTCKNLECNYSTCLRSNPGWINRWWCDIMASFKLDLHSHLSFGTLNWRQHSSNTNIYTWKTSCC